MPTLAHFQRGHLARVRDAFKFGGSYAVWSDVQMTVTAQEIRVVLKGQLFGRPLTIDLGIPVSQAASVSTLSVPLAVFDQMLANSAGTNVLVSTGPAITAASLKFALDPNQP